MQRFFSEIGRPLDGWFIRFFALASSPAAACKWLSVSFWVTSALLFYEFLRKEFNMTEADCMFSAGIAVSLPFFDLLGELALFMNAASVFLFWLAWFLVASSNGRKRGAVLAQRVAAILLLFISFNLNSHLPYFYAILACVLSSRLCKAKMTNPWVRWYKPVLAMLDLALLPIVFWLWKTFYTPTKGWYSKMNYNAIDLNVGRLLSGLSGVLSTLRVEALEAFSSPSQAISIFIAALVLLLFCQKMLPQSARSVETRWYAFGILAGCCLVFSAVFAYLVVGKVVSPFGWNSRNGVLLNFPVALLIVMLVRYIQAAVFGNKAWVSVLLFSIVISANIVACNLSVLKFQSLWMQQVSAASKIRSFIKETNASAVNLRDYLETTSVMETYPPIIWTFLVSNLNSPPSTFVLETQSYFPKAASGSSSDGSPGFPLIHFTPAQIQMLKEATSMDYALTSIPENGRTISCVIQNNLSESDMRKSGFRYLYLKYTNRAQHTTYIQDSTRVQLVNELGVWKTL